MIISGCSCSADKENAPEPNSENTDSLPMLVMQIRKHSRLYTAEYRIKKIVTHDDVKRLKGTFLGKQFDMKMPIGDRKIAIPMSAKLKAYIDFSSFSEKNIERNGNKITIILPDPKVTLTSSKIDRKNIKEFVSITRSHFTDKDMTDYENQGREAIISSITRTGIIETAQENAAQIIIPMIEQMGYEGKDITVTFRKQFDESDLKTLIDATTVEKIP
jgi:hypothetical protein